MLISLSEWWNKVWQNTLSPTDSAQLCFWSQVYTQVKRILLDKVIQNNNLIALVFLGPEKIQELYPRTVLRNYRNFPVRECRQYKWASQEQQAYAAMLLPKMWSNNYCLGQKISHLWEELQPLDPNSRSVAAKGYYLTKKCFQPWGKTGLSTLSSTAKLQDLGIS